jgi:hypothetical protein
VKIPRSIHIETLADLGNGCKLSSYWPESTEYAPRPYPLIYVQQGMSAAPLRPEQVPPLIEALQAMAWDNDFVVRGDEHEAAPSERTQEPR